MVTCCLLLTLFMLQLYSWRIFFLQHLLIYVFCLRLNISKLHVFLCVRFPTCWLTSEECFLIVKCLLSVFYSLMKYIEPLFLSSIYFENPKLCSLSLQQLLSVSNFILWLLVTPKNKIIDVYLLFNNNG